MELVLKAGIQALALALFSSIHVVDKVDMLIAHDLMKYCHLTMLKESSKEVNQALWTPCWKVGRLHFDLQVEVAWHL